MIRRAARFFIPGLSVFLFPCLTHAHFFKQRITSDKTPSGIEFCARAMAILHSSDVRYNPRGYPQITKSKFDEIAKALETQDLPNLIEDDKALERLDEIEEIYLRELQNSPNSKHFDFVTDVFTQVNLRGQDQEQIVSNLEKSFFSPYESYSDSVYSGFSRTLAA